MNTKRFSYDPFLCVRFFVFSTPVAKRGESAAGESLVMLLITIRFSCLTTAGNQAMDDAMNCMDYFASGFLQGKGKRRRAPQSKTWRTSEHPEGAPASWTAASSAAF
jgi:hypothetical protein